MSTTSPTKIRLHRRSQTLELVFEDAAFHLGAEYLRVFSPSAEVKGHGPGQEVLQLNKSSVAITAIEAQGNYAIRIIFSDHHDSGIYSWHYLKSLAENYEKNWAEYLRRVEQHEATKDLSVIKIVEPPSKQ